MVGSVALTLGTKPPAPPAKLDSTAYIDNTNVDLMKNTLNDYQAAKSIATLKVGDVLTQPQASGMEVFSMKEKHIEYKAYQTGDDGIKRAMYIRTDPSNNKVISIEK